MQLCVPLLILGAKKHRDPSFLTILLQDQVGGLQVLQQDHWVSVNPIHGSLVVNVGVFLQVRVHTIPLPLSSVFPILDLSLA